MNLDVNVKFVSGTISFDDQGFNGVAVSFGSGVGLSGSYTATKTISIKNVVDTIRGWFK